MKTTLNKIQAKGMDSNGWKKLLAHLGKTSADDEPLSLLTVLESNGLVDTVWCFHTVDGHDRAIRLFMAWCAREVENLMVYDQSRKALNVAERFANGEATTEELASAYAAAVDAVDAAYAAYAARAFVYTAEAAAAYAAHTAASAAARAADAGAYAAVESATRAAGADAAAGAWATYLAHATCGPARASDYADFAARAADADARAKMQQAQEAELRRILSSSGSKA